MTKIQTRDMTTGSAQKRQLAIDLIFVGLAAVFFLLWAWQSSYMDGPDELMRYDIVNYLVEHWSLPRGDDPSIINPIWGFSYAFQPYIPHIFSALFIRIAKLFTEDMHVLIFAGRLASVFFGAGTVWFTIKIARKLLPAKADGWIFIFLVTFLPQMVYLNSYMNCESMAIFSTAVIVYSWIIGLERKWDMKNCIWLGVGLSLCALSYVTAYGFLLCSFFLFCLTILLCQDKKWDFKSMIQKGLVVLAVFLVLAGWWFIRNAFLYQGDFLGLTARDICGELHAQDAFKPSKHWTIKMSGVSASEALKMLFWEWKWHSDTFKSFIGIFKEMAVLIPTVCYTIYKIIFAVGILGCIIEIPKLLALRKDGKWLEKGFFNWFMILALIIPNVLNLYASYAIDYQPQGRYSMPMLIPLMYFTVYGITKLLDRFIKNKMANTVIKILICVIVLGISFVGFWSYRVACLSMN